MSYVSLIRAGWSRNFFRLLLLSGLIGLLGACAAPQGQTTTPPITTPAWGGLREPWVLVDTKSDTLSIMQGQRPVHVFRPIAVGASGVGLKYGRGDKKTPTGVFRVGWINERSKFKTFIGLDYPNLDYAKRALKDGRIDALTYEQIRVAWEYGYTPPQDTPLGGQIGIHGVGQGDPWIHDAGINWTNGCVALNNYQIMELRSWVRKGTRVEIR